MTKKLSIVDNPQHNFTLNRLKIVLKSKVNKKKRSKHIRKLEWDLGIERKSSPNENSSHRYSANILISDLEMRRFYDGVIFEDGMEEIDLQTVKQYRQINKSFNPDYRVELSTLKSVPYAVIRTVDGSIVTHIYLTKDYSTIVICGENERFKEIINRLELYRYIVIDGPDNCYEFEDNPF